MPPGFRDARSYAALPALLGIAQRHGTGPYVAALGLAGGILASTDGPADPATVRAEHADAIRELRALTLANLASAVSDTDFVYGLEALMAFEDRGPWQRNLNHLADGELPLECPHCSEYLLLDLDRPSFLLSSFSDASCEPTVTSPAEPPEGSDERRILDLATDAGRTSVVAQLRHVFGDAACPCCRATFGIPGTLV